MSASPVWAWAGSGFGSGSTGWPLDWTGNVSAPLANGLEDRTIPGVKGDLRPSRPKAMLPKRSFRYDADAYRCSEGQMIPYPTTDGTGHRHWKSAPRLTTFGLLPPHAKAHKTVICDVWADACERAETHRLTDWVKTLQKRRKETVERTFADASQLFGRPYARLRSVPKVRTQCLCAATARNIKKIVMSKWNGTGQTA